MDKSIFYFKQLTATEVGNKGTHEIYIRMPNDFDSTEFFQSELDNNNGVLEKKFKAKNLTKGHETDELIDLRFAYFEQSNKEKRIPSLGDLFKANNVNENDIVKLESRIENNAPSYYITFLKPDEIKINPKSFCYSVINNKSVDEIEKRNVSLAKENFQQIFYGAPGTGKSHRIKKQLEGVPKENIFRTTFHPDSDYSTFVGAYKPTMRKHMDKIYTKEELISKLTEMKNGGVTYSPQKFGAKYWRSLKLLNLADKKDILQACGMSDNYTVELDKGIAVGEEYLAGSEESRIIYSFVPQTFLNAYIRAYQTDDNVYLIIEEINRGNCAQIFGDLFQLLDRDASGKSEYTIKADADLRAFLEEELGEGKPGVKDGELCLPPNLYIYATMNTSDQSLFPIDSAFKRRWNWEYEPIKYKNTDWEIKIGDLKYRWSDFQKEVNTRILNDTGSEDKMLGDYFVNPPAKVISYDLFRNKILFYLWNDVCKDGDADIFPINEEFSFSKLYDEDGKRLIVSMMDKLGLKPIGNSTEDKQAE